MVRVKICGITSLRDACCAIECGADAVGFVLAESPRKITLKVLKELGTKLPPFVTRVGVFVNEDCGFIKRLLEDGLIDYAQLHGDEDIEYCRGLSIKKVIKAIRPRDITDIQKAKIFKDAGAILIDSFIPQKRGGTGKISDWGLAIKAKKIGPPLILSGGLNIHNVSSAIETVRPYAVDVASGVEKTPGRKDYRLLKIFIERAKGIKYGNT